MTPLETIELASNRALALRQQFRGDNGTIVRVRPAKPCRGIDVIIRYCVEWKTPAMRAPAFWYYSDRVRANTDALKLLGEWIDIPNSK